MREPPPYAPALIQLLKGPIYARSTSIWEQLFRHRQSIEGYFAQIGLEVVVAEHDGLAFLRVVRDGEGSESALPELTVRRQLSYLASLLCVLLVEELYRFETAGGSEARLVMTRARIRELVSPYLPKRSNEAKQEETVNAQINNLAKYGFLRSVGDKGEELEVTKLLKYKIDASAIAEIKEKLEAYAGTIDA